MPRINRDANENRLIAKYGVPLPAYKTKQQEEAETTKRLSIAPKAKRKVKRTAISKHKASGWVKTQKEFLRWKKTDDFKQWKKTQFAKQDALCYYCDIPLRGIATNVEHIIPKSKGGTNNKKNLVLACWKCNKAKNATMLSKKKRKELLLKHIGKSKAWSAQQSFMVDLANRLQ